MCLPYGLEGVMFPSIYSVIGQVLLPIKRTILYHTHTLGLIMQFATGTTFLYTCTLINYTLIVFFKLYFYYSGEQHVKLC